MSVRIESIMVEFFSDLELLGPTDPASTSRAIEIAAPSNDALIVDAGCGTGRQTFQLLQETSATVVATDLHFSMLASLRRLSEERGVADRFHVAQADMGALPFGPESIDLLWSEGAIYNIGFEWGLRTWRPLLRPGGHLCITEAAYFKDDPPEAVRELWESEYPAITTQARLEEQVKECGYSLVDSFRLPKSAWEAFYDPVVQHIEELDEAWSVDHDRRQVLSALRDEIDIFRRYGDSYGYVFLVLRD